MTTSFKFPRLKLLMYWTTASCFFIFLALFSGSCIPKDPEPCDVNMLNCLPEQTINSTTCRCECPGGTIYNGSACVASHRLSADLSGDSITGTFEYYTEQVDVDFNGDEIIIDGFINDTTFIYIRFQSDDGSDIVWGNTYSFLPSPSNNNLGQLQYPFGSTNLVYDSESGSIHITKLDHLKKILKAEFTFEAEASGSTRSIKNGIVAINTP